MEWHAIGKTLLCRSASLEGEHVKGSLGGGGGVGWILILKLTNLGCLGKPAAQHLEAGESLRCFSIPLLGQEALNPVRR